MPPYGVLRNEPPKVVVTQPGRDTVASALEEVLLQAKAEDDFGVPFPSAHDGDGDLTVARLGAYAPPQTFFVAADGEVVGRKVGEITSQDELDGLVEKYLGVQL